MDQTLHFLSPIAFASLFSYFITRLLIPLSNRVGLLDYPNTRKKHSRAIPVVGGVAIYTSLVTSAVIFLNLPEHFLGICLISGVIILLGMLDDRFDISPKLKFLFQLLTSLALASVADISVTHVGFIFEKSIDMSLFSIPFTVLGIIAFCNAYNMLDGLDGLAASVSLVALVSLGVITYGRIPFNEFTFIITFSTILLVFLTFNLKSHRSQIKIFMGDAGSMFLGSSIAIACVFYSQQADIGFRPMTSLWISALPVFDMIRIIYIRWRNNRSIMQYDRNHIHHIMLNLGYSEHKTLLILISLSVVLATVGIILNFVLPIKYEFLSLALLIFCLSIYINKVSNIPS